MKCKEDKMKDKRHCEFCNKLITKSKDEWYSIVLYDKDYKKAGGEVFCPKCAKFIYRIMVAHYEEALYPIRNKVDDQMRRLKLLKNNVKKIK